MNWGHKILIVIILFLAGMLGMVYFAFRQSNEMIDDHYYERELKFQSIIDAQKNLLAISANNIVHQDMDEVYFTFPPGTYEQLETGTIELLRNDSQRKDVKITVESNGSDRRSIPKSSLSKGMYKARISWSSGGKPFYKEENLFVE